MLTGRVPFLSGFAADNLLQPKLAHILELCRHGWSAHTGTMPPAVLKPGSKKKAFCRDTSKSKFYFIAMLESAHIFSSMDAAFVAKANKVIKHNMPHSYYIGLVKLVGKELKTLVDLESTSEADFHKLVANNISCDDGENDDEDYAMPVPIAAGVTDASELHAIVQQVLGVTPMTNIERVVEVAFPTATDMIVHLIRPTCIVGKGGGRGRGRGRGRGVTTPKISIKVNFDNACHPSGKQRAFVACPRRDHGHCYKWRNVEQAPDATTLIAELTAWSMLAAEAEPGYDKEQHMRDWPSQAQITHYAGLVPEAATMG